MALRDYLVGEVAEDFTDGLIDRREALRRLGMLGLGLTGAAALLAACGGGGDDTASPTTGSGATSSTTRERPTVASTEAAMVRFPGPSGELQGALAVPAQPRGAVLVIHENRGLTEHFLDLVGRLAAEGYATLCVDLLSPEGGTALLGDPGAAPALLGDAPDERLLADLGAGIDELERRAPGVKIGAVGFCFGGGMAWQLLDTGEPRLAAVIPFYGPAPEDPDFGRSRAAVLGIYAGNDTRVNMSRERATAALERAGLVHEVRTFEGADHAFFNDTSPRHNPDAAAQAWTAVLAWLGQHLA